MRFSPGLKARYDYGMLIFILTFCMVTLSDVSGHELFEMAYERLLTIIIGSFIAILVCICIYPVWVGEDLHNQIAANIAKLSDFLEGMCAVSVIFFDKTNNTVSILIEFINVLYIYCN